MAWLIKQKRVPPGETRKRTYYRIGWREQGALRTRAIGFTAAKDAKAALKAFEARLALGLPTVPELEAPTTSGDGSSPEETTARSYTLGEYLFEVWHPAFSRNHAPKTNISARTSARNLRRIVGDVALESVDFAVAERYLAARASEGKKSRTRIIELRALKQCLQHAVDSGTLRDVPKLPTVKDTDRSRQKYLTPEQSVKLLDALRPLDVQPYRVTRGRPPVNRDRLTYLVVLMALNTGMRKGELLSRRWEDVLWGQGLNGVLLVRDVPDIAFRVKKGRERAVPLSPQLRAELERAHGLADHDAGPWMFPSPGDPMVPRRDFIKALKRACRRAGIPEVSPHSLRHTWATRFAMAGCDRRTLMELGGWKCGEVLDTIYAHTTDAHKDAVVQRLGIEASAGPTRIPRISGQPVIEAMQ